MCIPETGADRGLGLRLAREESAQLEVMDGSLCWPLITVMMMIHPPTHCLSPSNN